MAKGDKFYYENLVQSTAFSCKAANYLVECLENYDPEKMSEMLETMHVIEHSADLKKHEMNSALTKAFVTPVDREDLDALSHKLDDLTDVIEEVLQKFYIHDIRSIRPDAIDFAHKIVRSCELVAAIMAEFENFKKSKKIRELIIELNSLEEECDRLYLKSMHELSRSGLDVLQIVSWREIYSSLETCVDDCERVSESVGSVVMKNT